jgi:hypothetical protein
MQVWQNKAMGICLASPSDRSDFLCGAPPAMDAAELKAELVNKVWEGRSGASLPTGPVQLT